MKNGNEIIIRRLGHASDKDISALLTGTSFAALLHQLQMLPLHASTVIYNNKCLVFAGIPVQESQLLQQHLLKPVE